MIKHKTYGRSDGSSFHHTYRSSDIEKMFCIMRGEGMGVGTYNHFIPSGGNGVGQRTPYIVQWPGPFFYDMIEWKIIHPAP